MPVYENWYQLNDSDIPIQLKNDYKSVNTYCMVDGVYKFYTEIEFIKTVHNWVVNNIQYQLYANCFHEAQKTLDEKKANCANSALLILSIAYNISKGKIKGQLVYCSKKILHYTTRFFNQIVEPGITNIYEVVNFDNIKDYIKNK
jgi:hypothetical protein